DRRPQLICPPPTTTPWPETATSTPKAAGPPPVAIGFLCEMKRPTTKGESATSGQLGTSPTQAPCQPVKGRSACSTRRVPAAKLPVHPVLQSMPAGTLTTRCGWPENG